MISLIVTKGIYSLDKYSQELGKRLKVNIIETKIPTSFKEGYHFIRLLRRNKNNILHLPNQNLARYINFLNKPCIITVHDLTLQFFPNYYYLTPRMKIYIKFDILGLKKAKHIIANSKNTKKDIIDYLKINEDKITVIYPGVDYNLYYPRRNKLFDFKYILFVGSEQPRKNFVSLLRAFHMIKKDKKFNDLKLVKVGPPGLKRDRKKTLKAIDELDLNKDVILTNFVPEEKLPFYYSNAEILILPSFYEGFGLPVIEAMACGCPVITSNLSSLPEVVGDAGIIFEPYNIQELVNSIKEVIKNKNLRNDMRERGLKRTRMFSWNKTAKETMKVYERFK